MENDYWISYEGKTVNLADCCYINHYDNVIEFYSKKGDRIGSFIFDSIKQAQERNQRILQFIHRKVDLLDIT